MQLPRRLAVLAARYCLHRVLSYASLLILEVGLILPFYCPVQAQTVVCGSDDYLKSLPVPAPMDEKNVKRQVQLVNCSDQILLGAANAAHEADKPPYPVFPQEGTWVMQPYKSGSNENVLTIDIPPEWYGQFKKHGVTPIFWARTGCRYDPVANRAQCETGGCGGQYDCSSANLATSSAATLAEWTFYQQVGGYFIDSPDISAVNGANLTIDISPRGGHNRNPMNEKDFHWLDYNYPLTVHGVDLRDPSQCVDSGFKFKVNRSDIDKTMSSLLNYPLLGYVPVDSNGKPTMPPGDNVLAGVTPSQVLEAQRRKTNELIGEMFTGATHLKPPEEGGTATPITKALELFAEHVKTHPPS